MKFSGNNTLSISQQTDASFLVDISLDNINGLCNLGFTGVNENVNFKFTNGKIFDPENKLIYTYNPNQNIKLSGNINSSGYDYYINDYYLSNISSKSYGKFNKFYLNTSGCTGSTEIYINGDRPNYKLDFNNFYYVRENITGSISGDQNLNFKIYSGEIIYPANSSFRINTIPSFDQNISGQKYNIIVTPDFDTTKQLYLDKTGNFIFGLYTNFGKISGAFQLNSQYLTTGYVNYFNVNKTSETFFTQPAEINIDSYVLGIDFALGNETGTNSISKDLSFVFEYASGYTGSISETININTGINSTLTGFISGSGYLSNTIIATGSGINLLNNQIVTGLITNNVSEFIYLNGFVINDVNILGSGIKKSPVDQTVKITGNDTAAFDFFGISTSLNSLGNIALVGAYLEDPNGVNGAGAAYIFTGSGNSWVQTAKITGNDTTTDDNFGISVSLNSAGNVALIGAHFDSPNGVSNAGSAYLFTGSGNSWVQTAKITGNDAEAGDNFGYSTSLNSAGSVALVGAWNEDPRGATNAGSAYFFSINDKLSYANVTGKISGFSEAGILPHNDNIINIINDTSYTGYLSSIIATGIASGNYDLLLTGLADITYQKTFTGTFNIVTGYCYLDSFGNLIPTGNINFRSGNYTTNGKYASGSNVPSNINQINISIEKTNFYDNYAMSGNLYITGKNLINNLVTGVKIPVISTGINANFPNNFTVFIG